MLLRCVVWLQFILILDLSGHLHTEKVLDKDKQLFPPHLIGEDSLNPKREIVRRKIVLYHNFFRSKVRPIASNMLLMSWHPKAARQAQRYAEQCVYLTHNDIKENTVPSLGTCGQNLFVAAQKTPWFFAIKTWFVENENFTYGDPNVNLTAVGHYTQMVWATSYKVGCGLAHCSGGPWGHFYNYVCHYCPGGNILTIAQYPYKTGEKCSDCPDHCTSESLCTNFCPVRDYYSNCDELVKNIDGFCKQGMCNATCSCGSKLLHKNYPWS
ncbi:cysteine-rich venom protein ENH1 [Bombyx mori]|uniref:SCP domain-containing protein n=1 Tax=Bombyx mori TaxID=7091 RepID=A0A8R2DNR5_BOMMO|nr:cysteine-rich venom protein ENH1 [Bombyx mori]XP_021206855.1 cysteine-rich venom protein ENH1 [Bombyx mori]